MPRPKIITCYTTISDKTSADNLIKLLLELRLIACGVTWSANSHYNWEQERVSEEEYVIYMKSSRDNRDRLMSQILDSHPYDVPCILINEIECNLDYFNWVEDQTN